MSRTFSRESDATPSASLFNLVSVGYDYSIILRFLMVASQPNVVGESILKDIHTDSGDTDPAGD